MIKLSSLNGNQGRIVRETTAPFIVVDENGVETTEQMRVRYYSLSGKAGDELTTKWQAIEKKRTLLVVDLLLPVLESLPDIVDDKGKPVKLTEDVLKQLNNLNIKAIQKAIEDDTNPKAPPTK